MGEPDLEISPQEVAALMKVNAVILIDVRTPQEFEVAKIEGSRLIDQALAEEIVGSRNGQESRPVAVDQQYG